MSDTFTPIGKAAASILDRVAEERRKRSWVKRLHAELDIPYNYALASGREPQAPHIAPSKRQAAIRELIDRKAIKSDEPGDLMAAMCARIAAAYERTWRPDVLRERGNQPA